MFGERFYIQCVLAIVLLHGEAVPTRRDVRKLVRYVRAKCEKRIRRCTHNVEDVLRALGLEQMFHVASVQDFSRVSVPWAAKKLCALSIKQIMSKQKSAFVFDTHTVISFNNELWMVRLQDDKHLCIHKTTVDKMARLTSITAQAFVACSVIRSTYVRPKI